MRRPVTALLGPTNTGKTYLAIERMLEHPSGMIGFPLRLLARENYDRVRRLRGDHEVALVTGEERIWPRSARYLICTVEAMPLDREVDFLAVDEVQLAADRERGHVFTDRLLNARGRSDTMLLGAETIAPLIRRLVPEAAFISRPRLSTLTYTEPRKLSHLPRRSAVVAFSVAGVYALAERMRHERGGAALVFGALSPRTRNAQVGLYQAGDVDYLVATDAIGMGLNLDIDHVAFTGLAKHDGRGPRGLRPEEVAQIAGRAGRHLKDGSFGATAELGGFPRELASAVEGHRFQALPEIFWRNRELDFASPRALLHSLEQRPPSPVLRRMKGADDQRALEALSKDAEVQALARRPELVRLLWDVCCVPDFRSVMDEAHTWLLGRLFRHLANDGRLPEAWVAAQVASLDRVDGDVDALLLRIAHVRTWTYLSHRKGWLDDAEHWQQRARAVEDRLSDALHERLTEQFVDRRAAVLVRSEPGGLLAEVGERGEVLIQGLPVGRLEGFRFEPEPGLKRESPGLLAAANKALRADAPRRVQRLIDDPDEAFALLTGSGELAWRGAPVGRLVAGDDALAPRLDVFASELLETPSRERVRKRLASWLADHLRKELEPLFRARVASLSGLARGLLWSVTDGLGAVPRAAVGDQVAELTRKERAECGSAGLVFGRFTLFLGSLRPESARLRVLLWAVRNGKRAPALPFGRPSLAVEASVAPALYLAGGHQVVGPRAVRIDRLDRLAAALWRHAQAGPFELPGEVARIAECDPGEASGIVAALGYLRQADGRFRLRDRRGGARGVHLQGAPAGRADAIQPHGQPQDRTAPDERLLPQHDLNPRTEVKVSKASARPVKSLADQEMTRNGDD
jgi:ATP-dependent RNA helicase SUPV3L1/SUV3